MFASTDRLNLRAYRASDRDWMLEMEMDPRVRDTLQIDYVVPWGPKQAKEFEERLEKTFLLVVIEAKPSLMRADGEGGDEGSTPPEKAEKDDAKDEMMVGEFALYQRTKKNRDVHIGIALRPRWWGKGIATEVLQWGVDYAFEQLNMHRVSLGVKGGNDRAMALYKKVGFVEEVRARSAFWQDGKWVDDIQMGMLEDEWRARRKQ